MRIKVLFFFCITCVVGPGFAQPDLTAGQRSYDICAGCHGFLGEGSELVGAPRLGGIEPWYLERQIQNFADGIRGHAEADTNGRRMALMAQAVDNDRELADLIAYIASLPEAAPREASASGASETPGAYALCAACHGLDGSGNEALGAPGVVNLDEWYFLAQLRLYADGLRGVRPEDALGAQMVALAASFDTEEERLTLAESVRALGR